MTHPNITSRRLRAVLARELREIRIVRYISIKNVPERKGKLHSQQDAARYWMVTLARGVQADMDADERRERE